MNIRIALVCACLLPACAEVADDVFVDLDDVAAEAEDAEFRSGPSEIESACWAVGVLKPTCADPALCSASWTCPTDLGTAWPRYGSGPMFTGGTNAIAALGLNPEDLPLNLRRFCLYKRVPNTNALPLQPPQRIPSSVDCPVVTPMGNALSSDLHNKMQAAYEAHAGGAPSAIATGTNPVHVAVVDTHSSAFVGATPNASHGPAIAEIVKELACNDSDTCAIDIEHALGLPLDERGVVVDPGGMFGTRAHLAIGIVEAVQAWKQKGVLEPLVINLSLGWTATGGVCEKSEENPWCGNHVSTFVSAVQNPVTRADQPTQFALEALHGALLYASCNGAVIVAAAGNTKAASCNEEQVAPAVWSQYRAPIDNECNVILGFPIPAGLGGRVPDGELESWPLVTPVAAVNHKNLPIAATRPGSETLLMAAGYHATADKAFEPMTGTSVSAATVTATAALMMAQAGQKTTWELMARMWANGRPSGWSPQMEQYRRDVSASSRIVMMCRAQYNGTLCSQSQWLNRLGTAVTGLENAAADAAEDHATAPYVVEDAEPKEDTCDVCGEDATVFVDPAPSSTEHWFFDSCDELTTTFVFDDGMDLTNPQPPPILCPDCPVTYEQSSRDTTATLSVDTYYRDAAYTWLGATLVITYNGIRPSTTIDLNRVVGLTTLRASPTVTIDLGRDHEDVRSVVMNLVVRKGTTVEHPSNQLLYMIR